MIRVDAHQHYWNPVRGDYGWMPPDDPTLSRAWLPVDLAPLLARHGIDATILVQAAPTVAETEYLLGIADTTSSVAGVVGWVDFGSEHAVRTLERLARHPKFVGVRPMIQDIPDDDWMLRPDLTPAFETLGALGLRFDALGFPRHLANFATILGRYPDLPIVVDHAMKPAIGGTAREAFGEWADGMTRIARGTSACVKLSGLVTEAGQDWQTDDLRPYADHLFRAFGPERVMWGSDWPVCQLAASYDAWIDAADALTRGLTSDERDAVFGGTAARFYGFRDA